MSEAQCVAIKTRRPRAQTKVVEAVGLRVEEAEAKLREFAAQYPGRVIKLSRYKVKPVSPPLTRFAVRVFESELKLFNGRIFVRGAHRNQGHGYIAAYSIKDAIEVYNEYTKGKGGAAELRRFWAHNAWGNTMNDIKPERGLWVCADEAGGTLVRGTPRRVL